ncbi:MAG: methyltransferase domain-containing protein, partial [Opitutales bacterium]
AGAAESIPLPARSVGLITAAQAFHWFEIDQARAEFLRILSPTGRVALIWNDRVAGDPVHVALDEVFASFGGAKRGALLAHENRDDVPRFFGANRPRTLTWPHAHRLDEAGLASLVFSRSYMPGRRSRAGGEIALQVSRIFRRLAVGGTIKVCYRTVAIIGQPAASRPQPRPRRKSV